MKKTDVDHVLADLYQRLQQRRAADPSDSYVASLYQQGQDKILQKIGEEAVETILAAKNGEPSAIIHETADLWFHCLVMLADQNISPQKILEELVRRFEK